MATLAVGVDLGGTNARAALVDIAAGKILQDERAPLPLRDRSPAVIADLVAALVSRVEGANSYPVAIGIAAMLGDHGHVVNAPNLGWRDVTFGPILSKLLGRPAPLHNDLNAIAVGEQRFGAARGHDDVLCVFVGTGVGSGIIANGKLLTGARHIAGEIGHVKVVTGGALCGCGQRGCLEAYSSGRVLTDAGNSPAAITTAAAHLGHVLATSITMLNSSRLVMGGGAWLGLESLRMQTRDALLATLHPPAQVGFEIVDSALGDHAGVLGAAALA